MTVVRISPNPTVHSTKCAGIFVECGGNDAALAGHPGKRVFHKAGKRLSWVG